MTIGLLTALAYVVLSMIPDALCAAQADRHSWPGYRGPRHDGTSAERIDPDKAAGFTPLWTTQLAPGIASCAVVGDRLWTAGGGKNYQNIYALNASTGAILWTRRLDVSKPNRIAIKGTVVNRGKEVWRNVLGACGWSTPTVAHIDGRKTLVQYSGTLVTGIDPATGKTLWLYGPLAAGLVLKGKQGAEVGSGATVVGNRVLFPSHALAKTICIEVRNGKTELRWERDISNHFVNGAASDGCWFVAACTRSKGMTLNSLQQMDLRALQAQP